MLMSYISAFAHDFVWLGNSMLLFLFYLTKKIHFTLSFPYNHQVGSDREQVIKSRSNQQLAVLACLHQFPLPTPRTVHLDVNFIRFMKLVFFLD